MPFWFWVAFGTLGTLVVVQGLAFLEVLRQIGQMRDQFHAQDGYTELTDSAISGRQIPDIGLVSGASESPVSIAQVVRNGMAALVFMHPGCVTCHSLARELQRMTNVQPDQVRLTAVVEGRSLDEARLFMVRNELPAAITYLDSSAALSQALDLKVKPAVLLTRAGVVVRAASVRTADQVDLFIHDTVQRLHGEEVIKRGADEALHALANIKS